MPDDLNKAKNRSKRRRESRRKKRDLAARKAARDAGAPPGYSAIPGSKTNGFRRRQGGKWVYWYPDSASTRAAGHPPPPPETIPGVAAKEEIASKLQNALPKAIAALDALSRVMKNAQLSIWDKASKIGEVYTERHDAIDRAVNFARHANIFAMEHADTMMTAMSMGNADQGGERLERFADLVQKAYQSHTKEPKIGEKVRNTNKKCKHFGSEGVVTAVSSLPKDAGKVIHYRCTNEGDSWDQGEILKKTPDQLSAMTKGVDMHFSDIIKAAKGGQRATHKYKARKPDGKGGWLYDYGDGKGFRKEQTGVKEDGVVSQAESDLLEKYNLEIVGKDKEKAAYIAQKVKEGIEKAADVCKMSPPVCKDNKGIPRSEMPQLLDDDLSDMLKSDKEKIADYDAKAAKKEKKEPAYSELSKKEQSKLTEKWSKARKLAEEAVKAGADPDSGKNLFDTYIDHLKAKGFKVNDQQPYEKVNVGQLKATQREMQAEKTFGRADAHLKGKFNPGKNPIVISSDGYILDGHHRFAAMTTIGPDRKMNVIRVDAKMETMLEESFKVPGVVRADMDGNFVSSAPPDWAKGSTKKGFTQIWREYPGQRVIPSR